MGLDLWSTDLAVLSACETAAGEVRHSEGVLGLRRTLVLDGARTQVMTQWQVDDEMERSAEEAPAFEDVRLLQHQLVADHAVSQSRRLAAPAALIDR